MSITIEQITEIVGCEACHEVAGKVWGEDSACPIPQMLVHAMYGGVVLLARDNGVPIGFVFSFPALYKGKWVLWSHETAVLPAYLHKGIGTQLKMEQWRIGAQMPFHAIAWTFDPLISRNAHFNLNKLQAQISEYKVDAYGIMDDLINGSLETDRFIAIWPFQSEDKPQNAEQVNLATDVLLDLEYPEYLEYPKHLGAPNHLQALNHIEASDHLDASHRQFGGSKDLSENSMESGFPMPRLCSAGEWRANQIVETRIPLDMELVFRESPSVASAWRSAFREAAVVLFEKGYRVGRFERHEKYGVYVWESGC
jgi:predicted GNAT superfamily acetyltransferase